MYPEKKILRCFFLCVFSTPGQSSKRPGDSACSIVTYRQTMVCSFSNFISKFKLHICLTFSVKDQCCSTVGNKSFACVFL